MASLLTKLRALFDRPPDPVALAEAERLRAVYRERCGHFRHLLSANKTALEVMADMEETLRGGRPFGLHYVRGASTRVTASVFQMVRALNSLTEDRYRDLYASFDAVRTAIEACLGSRHRSERGPLVLPIADISLDMADETGGKMANLGEIRRRLGISVPDGFVVTASGFQYFMAANGLQEEIDRRIQAANAGRLDEVFALSSSIQSLILRAPVPDDLAAAITAEVERLAASHAGPLRLAVRSSAVGEDALGASFAGQYRSELNVTPEDVLDTWREVVASKYGVTAMTYRHNRGIPDEDVAMCVGGLVMVDALAGGVAYSRNPLDLRDNTVVINAVAGLPKAVVDGSWTPDVFVVSRDVPPRLVRREIASKPGRFVCDPVEGVRLVELPEAERTLPSIDDALAVEIASLAAGFEVYYGEPQDIEWALAPDGQLVILQSRPLKEAVHEAPLDIAAAAGPDVPGGGGSAYPVLLAGGAAASPGTGAGDVYVVRRDADLLGFPDGAVLVVERSLPRWAPLLGRAAAVVAEAGGTAGHLASVAREYGVPALFGIEGCVAALEGAGTVTVDADNRRVHPGRIEALLERTPPRNLMQGSPVFETLQQVARLVVPLNLLDPESPSFAPGNCRTLHDITRFCHEKSVDALFGAHEGSPAEALAGKQLRAGVKLQYWVIDIDDGFIDPVPGKVVDIANIRSLPMLYLWDGMVAVPWAGPPMLDAQGFFSVVFESTANPDLEATAASPLANKNFLMVSADFCNLQARFGYHFCTVEAQAGDDAHGNYVSFHFKGGAASPDRRVSRALLVAEVLEEQGFRVDVKEDALFASCEGQPREETLALTRLLGYLIIHTRQVDMIMHNATARAALHQRLRDEMQTVRQRSAVVVPYVQPHR